MMKKSEEQKNIFVSAFLDCYTVSGIMKDQRMTVQKGLFDVEI